MLTWPSVSNVVANAYYNAGSGQYKIADQDAREAEVWFIDAGNFRFNNNGPASAPHANLDWYDVPSQNIDNNNPGQYSGMTGGSVQNPSSNWFFLHLSLGPILKNKAFNYTMTGGVGNKVLENIFFGDDVLIGGAAANEN